VILPEPDTCYRAVRGRDARFDGWFYTAVRTTGIYCRPSCPAITPRRANVTFYPSAAAAQGAGYRACKRCRPDASPGSPEWNIRGDLAGRALRLIGDGVVDREGVPGLATRLGYSQRQVHRTLLAEVGAAPIALARAQRAQTARVLLENTDLAAADVAFAAGFASVRQFNDTMLAVFATSPTQLRARRRTGAAGSGEIELRLPFRAPMSLARTLEFLGARAIDGVERGAADGYARVVRAPGGAALVTVSEADDAVRCTVRLRDLRDLVAVVARVRRLLDLDADPVSVDAALAETGLRPAVRRRPGLRSPGAVDGFELAVRAIVGQQVSVRAARTTLARLVRGCAEPAFDDEPWLLFPTPEAFLRHWFGDEAPDLRMPRARAQTLRRVATAMADGDLDLDVGADRDRTRARLLTIDGIGPWTADYLLMRALGDPDVLLHTDLGVRAGAAALGVDDLPAAGADWAPWRSYATHHLWAAAHDNEES
jgi:AraC family transcriptional regulator of adaptative response / DNA-3-methyladenine glycosylase II